MIKVLLTGATGLLGSHLTEIMLKSDIQVYAPIRKIPKKSFIGSLGGHHPKNLILIESDLESYRALPGEVFDFVIHSAAKVSSEETHKNEIWHTNFELTKDVHHRLQGKFKKWVQVSSIATLCNGNDEWVDESYQGHARDTHYAQSKLKADQWLMENDPDSLIIHPTYMLGRWDSKPSSGAILFALKMKKISSYENRNKNFVAASDVATGILQAMSAGHRGHFILGNQDSSIEEFLRKACKELNIVFDVPEEKMGSQTQDFIREFCLSSKVSSDKAKKCFNYAPEKDIEQQLKESMDFFEMSKMLKRSPIISN